ncbi:MAG: hypothetical protein HZB99_02745 [Candidatus Harrisonbacteria bacterium]|nr:hypothetical protein [Candidatus Harrisonbacteria bacterium]
MDRRVGCEYCKLIYGFEEPKRETIFATRHFLAFWDDETKQKILVIGKDHGWTPQWTSTPQGEKEIDFKKAQNQAMNILSKNHPSKLVSTYAGDPNQPPKDHFSLIAQATEVPPNYGW